MSDGMVCPVCGHNAEPRVGTTVGDSVQTLSDAREIIQYLLHKCERQQRRIHDQRQEIVRLAVIKP